MPQENFNDLAIFAVVATERSFTRAAAKLGVSQSALSHTIRNLEQRLRIRLLTRTTRSVSPTEAGAQLLRTIGPRFDEISAELNNLQERHDTPTGTIRITAGEHPAISVIAPVLSRLLPEYPHIQVELLVDYGLTDIVSEQFDAGVRLGEKIAKDMIAVRISPDIRWRVVGSPAYFQTHGIPHVPNELTAHRCINIRFPTHGEIFAWRFRKDAQEMNVRVEGPVVFNNIALRLHGALTGLGLAYLPEDQVDAHIRSGHLIPVLDDWCAYYPGYHLYYPDRRHASSAFSLLVDALRYKDKK